MQLIPQRVRCWWPSQDISWWRHQMETLSALLDLCAGIHQWPVNSPHKGQWRGALKFSLICAWINAWVNNHEAGDLRRHRAHYDAIVMMISNPMRRMFFLHITCGNIGSHRHLPPAAITGTNGIVTYHLIKALQSADRYRYIPCTGTLFLKVVVFSWPLLLFTKRTDVLPQYLVKSRSREIRVYTFPIALKFNRHFGSSVAEMPVKFQSDTNIITSNLLASRDPGQQQITGH